MGSRYQTLDRDIRPIEAIVGGDGDSKEETVYDGSVEGHGSEGETEGNGQGNAEQRRKEHDAEGRGQ